MKTFREHLLNEADEAKVIRALIKKELGLSAKDVSVRTKAGGYSSSVNVSVKTLKGMIKFEEIEEIGDGQSSYERDEATQEILSGGNTFIFVEMDYKLHAVIEKLINAEIEKQMPEDDDESFTLFNAFDVSPQGRGKYAVLLANTGSVRKFETAQNKDSICYAVMGIISSSKSYELYSKIK